MIASILGFVATSGANSEDSYWGGWFDRNRTNVAWVVALAVAVLFAYFYRRRKRRGRPRLAFAPPTSDRDDSGKTFNGSLVGYLWQLTHGDSPHDLTIMVGPDDNVPLDLTAFDARLGALTGVARWLTRPPVFTLHAWLFADDERVTGCALALRNSSGANVDTGVIGLPEISRKEVRTPFAEQLVPQVAAWVLYACAPLGLLDKANLKDEFGTDNWRSCAAQLAGGELLRAGRFGASIPFSRLALDEDPTNRQARLNLAIALTGTKVLADTNEAIRQIDLVLRS